MLNYSRKTSQRLTVLILLAAIAVAIIFSPLAAVAGLLVLLITIVISSFEPLTGAVALVIGVGMIQPLLGTSAMLGALALIVFAILIGALVSAAIAYRNHVDDKRYRL